MKADFAEFGRILSSEFAVSDPDVKVSCEEVSFKEKPFTEELTVRLVTALNACPHGVAAMSMDIPGLVETSTNLASVKEEGEVVKVVTSQRSAAKSERRALAARVRACFELAGAKVEHRYEYPGWNPNVNSHVLAVCVESYRKLFNQEPLVLAIHAGLECGLFLEMFPGLDMISFGPTLRGVHAPGEKLELASLDKFVKLLGDVVCNYK